MATGWMARGSNPGKGKRFFCFRKRPCKLWGPSRFLLYEHGLPSREKSNRSVKVTNLLHQVPKLRMKETIHLLTLNVFMAWRGTFSLYFRKLRRKYVLDIKYLYFFLYILFQKFSIYFHKDAGLIQSGVMWHWNKFPPPPRVLPFSPVCIIPPLLHTHIRSSNTHFVATDNVVKQRTLLTLINAKICWTPGTADMRVRSHVKLTLTFTLTLTRVQVGQSSTSGEI